MSKFDLNNKEFEKIREQLKKEHIEESHIGYKCYQCGTKVNFIFAMDFLKKNNICGDCWSKDET